MYVYIYILVRAWPNKIKHEARVRDANKARGEAECFILRIARTRL